MVGMKALVCLCLCLGVISGGATATNKVLILSIDGTMPSALAAATAPNVKGLMSNGCYSVRVVTHPVTHSTACWSSMLTGVWGDKHGVNDPFNRYDGNQFLSYPSFFQRLEAANSAFHTVALSAWEWILWAAPHADVRMPLVGDEALTDEACRRLTNSNPDVLWALLLAVDNAGHNYGWGPTVSNYVRAIEVADGRVGQILGAMRSRSSYSNENWLVIVQTDHGEHDHPDPEWSRIVFSIYSGPSAARGIIWPAPAIVDVCATVLAHMNVPIQPEWSLDARVAGLPLQPTLYGTNLIFNGGAEANSGTNNYTTNRAVAWWFDLAGTTIGEYGANTNFPSPESPGPTNRGRNFFLGGEGDSYLLQRIDISAVSPDVDAAQVRYELAGWFGGAGADDDSAALLVRFMDASEAVLGTDRIGDVLAAERTNATALLARSTSGMLPAGTRFAEFTLTNHVVNGWNDASADNLSFTLSLPNGPAVFVTSFGFDSTGWRVGFPSATNRSYILLRSELFDAWIPVSAEMPGTGAVLHLTDTNPPVSQAFYRVAHRQHLTSGQLLK